MRAARALAPVLLAAAVLPAALAACDRPQPEPPGLPPLVPRDPGSPSGATQPLAPLRADVAGVPGFEVDSRVLFEGAPDRPHRLQFTCAFPERVRWQMTLEGDPRAARLVEYRMGPRVFALDENRNASRELAGADREAALRRMELRLATLFWPDGADWAERDGVHEAMLREAGGEPFGMLRASAAVDGRPTLFEALDAAGALQESLRVDDWREVGGRTWPRTMALAVPGAAVWSEEVESVRVPAEHAERTFLPVDRHGLLGVRPEVRALTLPARVQRTLPLDGRPNWDEAIDAASAHAAREAAALAGRGLELASALQLELGEDGRPNACVLQLRTPAAPPPEGWSRRPEMRALHAPVASTDEVDTALLEGLRASLPEGWRPERAYARLRPARDGSWSVSVVLPASPD